MEDINPVETRVVAGMNLPDSLVSSFEADKAFISECGYDTSDMVEYEDYYMVGSDLLFHKSYVLECRRTPQPKLKFSKTIREECQKMHLNVTCFDFSDDDRFKDAVKAWNEIGDCNLNFTYEGSAGSRFQISFSVSPHQTYSSLLTVSDPPLTGQPATEVCIKTDVAPWPELSSDQKKHFMMHALGHAVGLSDLEKFDDAFSIMQSHEQLSSNMNLWSGFSIFDIADLRQKYPLPKWNPEIEFLCNPKTTEKKEDWLTVGKTYRITTNYTNQGLKNPTFQYSIEKQDQNVACNLTNVGANACDLTFTAYGTCKLVVKVFDDGVEKDRQEMTYYGVIDKFTHNVDMANIQLNRFYDFGYQYWNPEVQNSSVNYSVKEMIFDDGTDKSVTIEKVGSRNARIRFNESGRYVVTASVVGNAGAIKNSSCTFVKLYMPTTNVYLVTETRWLDPSLPEGLNSTVIQDCNVLFSAPELIPERIAIDIYWTCTKHIYPYDKKILVSYGEVKVASVVRPKGSPSTFPIQFRSGFLRDEEGKIIRMIDVCKVRVAHQ